MSDHAETLGSPAVPAWLTTPYRFDGVLATFNEILEHRFPRTLEAEKEASDD